MREASDRYPHLDQLIHGYLHQDMDLVHGSEAEAVDAFIANEAPAAVAGLLAELDLFEAVHHNDLQGAFRTRYQYDIDLGSDADAVTAFLAMVRSRAAVRGSR